MRSLAGTLLVALATLAAPPARAEAPARAQAVPVHQRTLLVLRVLVYDRNLQVRAPLEVRVAVLFRPGDAGSERERDEVLAALASLADEVVAAGRPIRGEAVPYTSPGELDERLAALRPAAAWVGAALAADAAAIARVTSARKVLSAAGVRAAVEAGLAVGIVPGPKRAAVLVNVAAARGEGANLDAALLGIAEIVGGPRERGGEPSSARR